MELRLVECTVTNENRKSMSKFRQTVGQSSRASRNFPKGVRGTLAKFARLRLPVTLVRESGVLESSTSHKLRFESGAAPPVFSAFREAACRRQSSQVLAAIMRLDAPVFESLRRSARPCLEQSLVNRCLPGAMSTLCRMRDSAEAASKQWSRASLPSF
jgi:hypothetical protein